MVRCSKEENRCHERQANSTGCPLRQGLNRSSDRQEPGAGAGSRRRAARLVRGRGIQGSGYFSGAKGRDERPGLDKLLQAVARKEFDLVAAWSVDRIGRSLVDLVGTLQELHAKNVDLYLHQQGIDTTTPSGKAMFQMMGVFAEFERSMLRERVNAGLARARAEGTQLGRPAEIAGDAAR